MIIGLHSLDLVPKKAAGTAAGFTGFFGYVFGSAIAAPGWAGSPITGAGAASSSTMVGCCVLTIAFSALTSVTAYRAPRAECDVQAPGR
jgi:OPA family glycerol-3-phosphate transporter-like MFS transporter